MTAASALPRKSRGSRLPFVILCILLAAIAVGAISLWWSLRAMRLMTVTIINETSEPLTSIAVLDADIRGGAEFLELEDVPPGASRSRTIDIQKDRGPAWLHVRRGSRDVSGLLGYLLIDDGPFRYTVRFTPDRAILDGYEADDGSFTRDLESVGVDQN